MSVHSNSASGTAPAVRGAIAKCRRTFVAVGIFSAAVNLLALTGSIYMLQLYDRVLPSHSIPTLVGISLVMLLFYISFGLFDLLRTHLLSRIGLRIERYLRPRVINAILLLPLRTKGAGDGLQPIRDLEQIRSFLSSLGPIALFDLPWIPFYLGLVYLLHPWLGLLGASGALILVFLTITTEARSRGPMREAATTSADRQVFGEAARRNAEAVRALGMSDRISDHWSHLSEAHIVHQIGASDIVSRYGVASKVFRMVLQSSVLGLGAYLVIVGQASAGVMIASSILVSRALAPIEIAIANWRGFLAARHSSDRLSKLMSLIPEHDAFLTLPEPQRSLTVEGIWVAAPGERRPVVQDVSLALEAGDGLGIIGPAAAGKSTLARALVGAWLPLRGVIRLDGAALDQWPPESLGRHIGYLPQDVELFAGTVAQNIARFDPKATSDAIVEAASQAGVHSLILRLPDGYQTQIGDGGTALSAGQRQRIALARALYGNPFLIVLDEPNSNLDATGDAALVQAIAAARSRDGIVIVVTHRQSVLASLNRLLVLGDGHVRAFGPRDEVLREAAQNASPAASSARPPGVQLKVIAESEQGDA